MKFNFTSGTGRTPLEQLQNTARSSSLYDEEVLSSLANNEQQLSYLQMVATSNSLALKNRLGNDYAGISDKNVKFQVLENEYNIAMLEKAISTEAFQQQLQDSYNKNLNDRFAADERISKNNAVSTIVQQRYDGDYSKFMGEYKDADTTLQDEYLGMAEVYDEDETRETLEYMKDSATALSKEMNELEKLYSRRDALNQYIAQDKIEQKKKLMYENASFWEKGASAVAQMVLAPVTEVGNIIEGLIDTVATVFNQTDFVSKDIINLDAILAEALPNSYITSPYSNDNPFKFLYELETSLIDLAPMAVSLLPVPGARAIGSILYYASSSGRSAEGYILENPDASYGSIVAYTGITTAIEALTEKINTDPIFGKGFFKNLEGALPATGNKVFDIFKQGIGEGIEEVASEIGSQLVGSIMTGNNKFDVKQVLRAGALGAATGMVIQTYSTEMFTRRALRIGTKISTDTGAYMTLNARESMIVEDFMEKSKKQLDNDKKLSKRDQRIYDAFSKLNFSDEIIDHRMLSSITPKGLMYDAQYTYAKAGIPESDAAWLKRQRTVGTKGYTIPENTKQRFLGTPATESSQFTDLSFDESHRKDFKGFDTTRDTLGDGRTAAIYSKLYNYVQSTGSLKVAMKQLTPEETEAIMPEKAFKQTQEIMNKAAATWMTSLIKDAPADINSQSVMSAVNEYYYDTLDTVVEKCNANIVPAEKSGDARKVLSSVMGLQDAEIVDLDKDKDVGQILKVIKQTYNNKFDTKRDIFGKIHTYITGSKTTPIVSIIGGDLYVNAKFLTKLGSQSIIRAIEMERITNEFTGNLLVDSGRSENAVALSLFSDLVAETTEFKGDRTDIRMYQLWQRYSYNRIAYSAVFAQGNDLAIQLSQANHAQYEKLRDILTERTKSASIAIKNAAYQGLRVYDSTILQRMSEDEATESKLLSGNYDTKDLLKNAKGTPNVNREFLRYGIDMSKGAIKVLSAVRHLSTEFGFETSTDNFYQTLKDIQNIEKYKNIRRLNSIIMRYNEPFEQAINHYLVDQFDFEIGSTGNIIATASIEQLLDTDKLKALGDAGQNQIVLAELSDVLTDFGRAELSNTNVTLAFVPNSEWSGAAAAEGVESHSQFGKSLIQIRMMGKSSNYYQHIDAHEIQHYLTATGNFPAGAGTYLNTRQLGYFRKELSDDKKAAFDIALKKFILNNSVSYKGQTIEDLSNIDLAVLLDEATDILYCKFDVDEDYSNFKATRQLIHSYTTTVTDFLGTPKFVVTYEVAPNANLDNIDREFLEFFDGYTTVFASRDKQVKDIIAKLEAKSAKLDDVLSLPEEFTEATPDREARTSKNLEKLKGAMFNFNGEMPTDGELCDPQYLASKCTSSQVKQRILSWTREQCIANIERITGKTLNEYTGTFVDEKGPVFEDYVKYIDKEALVVKKPEGSVIQLPRDFSSGKYKNLEATLANMTKDELSSAKFYVDDRIFSNYRAVLEYLDTSKVSAVENLKDIESVQEFDKLIDNIIPNGFKHSSDFVYITNDGKIVSYDTKGDFAGFFTKLCKAFKIKPSVMTRNMELGPDGNPIGILEDGVAQQLFDAKKMIRAYFIDGQWQAFGKPNCLQDNLLRQLNVESDSRPYLQFGDTGYDDIIPGTTRLVVKDTGAVGIDRTGTLPYPEVSWKDSTWYTSICQIIEKYDIKKISELKNLGFNQEFLDVLSRNYGRAVQGKTAGKLGLSAETVTTANRYSGIDQNAITEFINDNAASEFARNLLIQNSFERFSTENLDWSKAPHIRSVSDANAYLNAIIMYSGTLQRLNNHKKYTSLDELILDCKKQYIDGDAENSLLSKIIADGKTEIYYENVISEFLNIDARQTAKAGRVFVTENLDYSLDGFNVAVNLLRRGYTGKKTVSTVSMELDTRGRKADDQTVINRIDTSSESLAKSKSTEGDAVVIAEEDSKILKWYQVNLKNAMKLEGSKRAAALDTILDKLNRYNQRTIDEIGETDKFVDNLITDLNRKIAGENEQATAKAKAIDKVISDAKARIDKSEDKRAQHQTEYNTMTQPDNKQRIIREHGEEGYRQILDALSSEAIFGDTTALTNVKDNISKRLRDNGPASILARIDKLYSGQTADKFKSLFDTLKSVNPLFAGVRRGTALATEMRFKYSNLLTSYYNFLKNFQSTRNISEFAKIKTAYNEVATYIDNLVLTGSFDFEKVYPEYGAWAVNAEKLINGDFESDSDFAALNSLDMSDRISMLESWILAANQNGYPEAVVDRMRKILEDSESVGDKYAKRPDKPKAAKPKIDMSILNNATMTAGLSTDAIGKLNAVTNTINEKAKEKSEDAAQKKHLASQVSEAKRVVWDATYLTRTYDRLTRKEKKYLDSPAITLDQAKSLIQYAAKVINDFDYQVRINAFLERARKDWENDSSSRVAKLKEIIKNKDEVYSNSEVADAKDSKSRYIKSRQEAYETSAAKEREEYLRKLAENREVTAADTSKPDDSEDEGKVQTKVKTLPVISNFDDLLNAFAITDIPENTQAKSFDKYYTRHRSLGNITEKAEKQKEHAKINSIINGVAQAVREFEYRPLTLASATKFMMDISSVLSDGVINNSFFGWKPVSIQREKREITHADAEKSVDTLYRLLRRLESGEFTSRYETTKKAEDKLSKEITGTIESLIENIKEETLTEQDTELDSELQQRMRSHVDDELEFEDYNIEELEFTNEELEFIPERKKLIDKDFNIDDLAEDDEFYTFVENAEQPKTEEPKSEKSKSSKKGDQRPIEEQFPGFSEEDSRSSYKTVKSPLLTRNGVDLETVLNYQFSETRTIAVMGEEQTRYNINTNEFISNPIVAAEMLKLKSNQQAMDDFLEWCKEARATSPEVQLKALIILNKLSAIPTIDGNTLKKIEVLRSNIKSVGGTILGLGNNHGLNPIEELCKLAKLELNISDDDKAVLTKLCEAQDAAIKDQNFTESDKIMKDALKIFEKYSDQLDDSINPFKDIQSYPKLKAAREKLNKAKTREEIETARKEYDAAKLAVEEERAVRWQNLTDKITSWRYFAMLSAPVTFWAKNEAGNAVARGMNNASTFFSNHIMKLVEKKRPNKYTRTNIAISENTKTAIDVQLVKNGLLNSLMANSAAKYESGFKYRPSAISRAIVDAKNSGQIDISSLSQLLNNDELVKGNTVFARGINKYYRFIFDTMNKTDMRYVAQDIRRLTERLVNDNMSASEIAELQTNSVSDATRAKFADMVDYAREEALKVYFRSTPKVYQTLMSMFKGHPIAQAIFSTICPFPRMVFNTTMTVISYSPLGFIQGAMTLMKDPSMYANITASQQLSRACVGTTAMLAGAILAAIGWIDIDDEDKYAGPQLVLLDTLRISLEGLEPSATPLIVGSMLVLGPKTDGEANAFSAAANALLNTTILGEIMSQFGQGKTATEWVSTTFTSYVTQFIPTVLKRATQLIDSGKKNYSGSFSTLKRIAATIPGLSFLVENKIDPYTGESQVQYVDNNNQFLSRLFILLNSTIFATKLSWARDSEVETESKAVDAATTGPARQITIDGETFELSEKQYEEYARLRAKLYSQYASDLIKTDAYKKLSVEKRKAKLKQLQSKATKAARKQLNIP